MRSTLKKIVQLVLVGAGVFLTVANSYDFPVRLEADPGEVSGPPLSIEIDRRVYRDHPFGVTLPAGTYSSLTLHYQERVEPRWDAPPGDIPLQPDPELVLRIDKGDPRLSGKVPFRVDLLFPQGQPEHWGYYQRAGDYLLTVEGPEGVTTLKFKIDGSRS